MQSLALVAFGGIAGYLLRPDPIAPYGAFSFIDKNDFESQVESACR